MINYIDSWFMVRERVYGFPEKKIIQRLTHLNQEHFNILI